MFKKFLKVLKNYLLHICGYTTHLVCCLPAFLDMISYSSICYNLKGTALDCILTIALLIK